MSAQAAVGVDLGGTNLKVALVDGKGKILGQRTLAVEASGGPRRAVADACDAIDRLLAEQSLTCGDLVGVGIGAPGPISYREARIIHAANLPGWQDVDLCTPVSKRLGTQVAFDNDGNAAAYGEYWAGAGRGTDGMVMLTLGTGVGAGVILDGQILHGHFDNAGELGHMIVVPDGLPCACGQAGCLEQYASASAVARRVIAAVEAGEACVLSTQVGGRSAVDARRVAEAARGGDALCLRIWDEACLYLAVACINIQHAYNPECIVVGGGMSEAGAFLIDRVLEHSRRHRWCLHDDFPSVKLASLGYHAGVVGAAGLAWTRFGEAK